MKRLIAAISLTVLVSVSPLAVQQAHGTEPDSTVCAAGRVCLDPNEWSHSEPVKVEPSIPARTCGAGRICLDPREWNGFGEIPVYLDNGNPFPFPPSKGHPKPKPHKHHVAPPVKTPAPKPVVKTAPALPETGA